VTRAEFFQCLKDSRDKFVWTVGKTAPMRTCGRIRAFRRDQDTLCRDVFCPITAVCYIKTELGYYQHDWQHAADAINLAISDDEQFGIVIAADGIRGLTRSELEEAIFGKVLK
jgi:hypothetical protein